MAELILNVNTNASGAASSITTLAGAMRDLATESGKFNGKLVADGLEKIATAASKITAGAIRNIADLANAMSLFAGVDLKSLASILRSPFVKNGNTPTAAEMSAATAFAESASRSDLLKMKISSDTDSLAREMFQNPEPDPGFMANKIEKIQKNNFNLNGIDMTDVNSAREYADSLSNLDVIQLKLASTAERLALALKDDVPDPAKVASLISEYKNLQKQIEDYGKTTKKAHHNISKMIGRMLLRRAVMAAIRSIINAVKVGVKNVYQYSKSIGGTFASAMDSAASSMFVMKNAIGTAVAPAIQALIPILNTVVSWVRTACNALSQFFALLRGGGTWTKATEYVTEWGEAAKGAGGAANDWLADWDELNVMAQGGGGGGSNVATDYENMFEEVYEFDEKIRDVAEFLKKHMEDIEALAISIGAAIIAWKVSTAFGGVLSTLGALLGAGATIAITMSIVRIFDDAYVDTGDNGWLIADALTSALGATIAGKLAAGVVSVGFGIATAGVTLILSAGVSIDTGKKSYLSGVKDSAKWLAILAGVKAGIGTALVLAGLGASTAVSIVAGVISVPLTIAIAALVYVSAERSETYEKMAKDAFDNPEGISASEYLAALQNEFNRITDGLSIQYNGYLKTGELKSDLKEALESIEGLSSYVYGKNAMTEEDAKTFKEAWGKVFGTLEEISKINFSTVEFGIADAMKSESSDVKKEAEGLLNELVKIQTEINGVMGGMKERARQLSIAISTGTATNEEYEEYWKLLSVISGDEHSYSQKEFAGMVEDARKNGLYFGEGGDSVEGANAFLEGAKKSYDASMAEIDEWYKAQTDSIDGILKDAEMLNQAGQLSDGKLNGIKLTMEAVRALITGDYEGKKSSVDKLFNEDVVDVLKTNLVNGFKKSLESGNTVMYREAVMNPMIEQLKGMGVDTTWLENLYYLMQGDIDLYGTRSTSYQKAVELFGQEFVDSMFENVDLLRPSDDIDVGFMAESTKLNDFFTQYGENWVEEWLKENETGVDFDGFDFVGEELYKWIEKTLKSGNPTKYGLSLEEITEDEYIQGALIEMLTEMIETYRITSLPKGFGFKSPSALLPNVPGAHLDANAGALSGIRFTSGRADDIPPATVASLSNATTQGVAEGMNATLNNGRLAADFETAMTNAMQRSNRGIDTANGYLRTIAGKNLTVNVGASSGLGRVVGASNNQYSRATGV